MMADREEEEMEDEERFMMMLVKRSRKRRREQKRRKQRKKRKDNSGCEEFSKKRNGAPHDFLSMLLLSTIFKTASKMSFFDLTYRRNSLLCEI